MGTARPLTFLILVLAVASSACGTVPAETPGKPETLRAAIPPEWRPGDRWVYRRADGTTNATRVVEVLETRDVKGARYYVLNMPDEELLNFWTLDLHWAFTAAARDSRVEASVNPPLPWFSWPLEVGRRWTHQGEYRNRGGNWPVNETFMVVGTETIDVPAGRFQTLKVVREGQSADSDQYWYAPEVRSHVRWILKRGDKRVEDELVEYRPAERLIPGPAKARSTQ